VVLPVDEEWVGKCWYIRSHEAGVGIGTDEAENVLFVSIE
jgi:hypothetical protein